MLRQNGMKEEAIEMYSRVTACGSYNEALGVISEYVQTELSDDRGILETDDIDVNPDVTVNEKGVIAHIETWFTASQHFGFSLDPEDSADLYVTVQPETGKLTACIIIDRESVDKPEYMDVRLLPCEQKLILSMMEENARNDNTSLKDLFAKWNHEHGGEQANSIEKGKKKQHER